MKTKISRLVARIGVVTAATGLAVVAVASPAQAVSGPHNVDPDTPVSLTVHKYQQPVEGNLGPNDGNPLSAVEGTALKDVEFTIREVTSIDLSTDAGWAAIEGLNASAVLDPKGEHTLGAPIVRPTDERGEIVLAAPEVGIGVYLVEETSPGPHPVIQKSAPFLVSLPHASATGTGEWNYDVHVYPKNALSAITKTVDDRAAFELGDSVGWTIQSAVPTLAPGTGFSNYRIEDEIEERLGYQGVTVTLEDGTSNPLQPNIDFTLTEPAAGASGPLKVEFTPAGLGKLNTAPGTAHVKLAIRTTVSGIGDGRIQNRATVFINNPGNGNTSDPAVTEWGALKIVKHVAGDQTKVLEGAVFNLYTEDPSQNPEAQPIASGITTGTNGEATIDGLKIGDYWLLESAAPTGYEKSTKPVPVTITTGSVQEAVVTHVPNSQVPPFALPLTGGQGTLLFAIGGSALLLLAGTVFLVARRRRAATSSEE